MLKIIVSIVVVILVAILSGGAAYYTAYKTIDLENQLQLQSANIHLYDLRHDLKLWESLNGRVNNVEILKISETNMLGKIYLVSLIEPDLSKLNWESMRAFCKALELNHKGVLFKYGDKQLMTSVTDYMNSIEGEARAAINLQLVGPIDGEDCMF
ncbi:hypothetical protein KA005_09295 [bacterium]|nr:hypothetical protein [bacterium]